MVTLPEIEQTAMQLPDRERAVLAAHLLDSLPSVLHDEDDGVAKAIRRDAELDTDPETGVSLQEFRQSFES
jgi:hypothetical protein